MYFPIVRIFFCFFSLYAVYLYCTLMYQNCNYISASNYLKNKLKIGLFGEIQNINYYNMFKAFPVNLAFIQKSP